MIQEGRDKRGGLVGVESREERRGEGKRGAERRLEEMKEEKRRKLKLVDGIRH